MIEHEQHHHDHPHAHEPNAAGDRSLILLRYMCDHNDHHADELEELIASLRGEGRDHAADLVQAALESYRKGNELLHEALSQHTEV